MMRTDFAGVQVRSVLIPASSRVTIAIADEFILSSAPKVFTGGYWPAAGL